MNWNEAVDALFRLEKRGIKLELTRMRAALDDLGRPQDAFPCILVAGTNGKGSTSASIASALSRPCREGRPGRVVGLYTSPHLLDYRERIRIDGRLADPDLLLRLVQKDWAVWMKHELSFFEATTALALAAFREAGVSIAVLEVGLGGRLDATNTVEPVLSVITSLGMDHAHLLGSTPEAIAREKAGIMRRAVPVAIAGGTRATSTLLERARETGAPAFVRRDCLRVSRLRRSERGVSFEARAREPLPDAGKEWRVAMPLPGAHQAVNGALAVLALLLLRREGVDVHDDEIIGGIARLRWPGRMERPLPGTPLLADVAHNREGARVLVRACRGLYAGREIRPVVGMVAQKDHAGFFGELKRIAGEARIAPLTDPRGLPAEDLAGAAAAAGIRPLIRPDVATALADALEGASDPDGPLVLLCGSFHTLDEGYRSLGIRVAENLWEEDHSAGRRTDP